MRLLATGSLLLSFGLACAGSTGLYSVSDDRVTVPIPCENGATHGILLHRACPLASGAVRFDAVQGVDGVELKLVDAVPAGAGTCLETFQPKLFSAGGDPAPPGARCGFIVGWPDDDEVFQRMEPLRPPKNLGDHVNAWLDSLFMPAGHL